jgi:hypothetical protein
MIYGYDDPWFGLIAFAVSTLGALLAICYYRIKY